MDTMAESPMPVFPVPVVIAASVPPPRTKLLLASPVVQKSKSSSRYEVGIGLVRFAKVRGSLVVISSAPGCSVHVLHQNAMQDDACLVGGKRGAEVLAGDVKGRIGRIESASSPDHGVHRTV